MIYGTMPHFTNQWDTKALDLGWESILSVSKHTLFTSILEGSFFFQGMMTSCGILQLSSGQRLCLFLSHQIEEITEIQIKPWQQPDGWTKTNTRVSRANCKPALRVAQSGKNSSQPTLGPNTHASKPARTSPNKCCRQTRSALLPVDYRKLPSPRPHARTHAYMVG